MVRLGKMVNKHIKSEFLQEEKQVKIYLPETFDNLYETKCCFMQDGDDYFQMGRVATLSDNLHENGAIQNTVFIGIHYEDRHDRLKKYHPSGDEYENYQRFLIEEVIPMIKDIVPINPLGTEHSLMGDSLAGTFAIVTALQYPGYFNQIIMQSPLIDDTVSSVIKAADKQHLSIYHSIGLNETAVYTTEKKEVDFVQPNKVISKYLKENFSDYTFAEIPAGNHTWKYWQEELPEVLEDMFG
ncbi:MAG TPA: alpha/beta hydrolase-fold protein [Alloiococcus sp.]|nr:alpha/beta hydrolase-fold protein [Alloiococcus sp.]